MNHRKHTHRKMSYLGGAPASKRMAAPDFRTRGTGEKETLSEALDRYGVRVRHLNRQLQSAPNSDRFR
jgi:hypothetical protein